MNYHNYKSCVNASLNCLAISSHCSSMDLLEKDVAMMSRYIQLNIERSAVCDAAAKLMSVGSELAKDIC